MMRQFVRVFSVIVFILPSACVEGGGKGVQSGKAINSDLGFSDAQGADSAYFEPSDLPHHSDATMSDSSVIEQDASSDNCTDGGCFGQPCDGPEDCWSGFCVPHLGDKICSKPCHSECPAGFSCQLISEDGSDPSYVCVSSVPHLCQPCDTSDQCDDAGLGAACVSYGDVGMFCGGACEDTSDCPANFDCEVVPTASGGSSSQCVAQSGMCACSDLSKELTLSTTCAVSNDIGSCSGERYCDPAGLTECDAEPATNEVCDGIDNDCDDLVDEDIACDDEDPCTIDACKGADGCVYTIALGAGCDDGDLATNEDMCQANGECIGEPIECPTGPCIASAKPNGDGCDVNLKPQGAPCDDGDNATQDDVCDAAGTCSGIPLDCKKEPVSGCVVAHILGEDGCVPIHAPMNALCDDGDPSTKNDMCDALGECAGTPYSCDDIAPTTCTPSYLPDGVGCAPQHAPVMTPCEDNINETKNDVCNGAGTCGGNLYDCQDEATSPCTPMSIPDGTGCVAKHAPQGSLCDDTNIMTKNDVCDGTGGCMGTPYKCADKVPDICTLTYVQDGQGCAPQHAPQGTPCMDGNINTKNDVCDGSGTCAGTPFSCNEPTNACLPSYTANGFGCTPNFAPPGTPCSDNQINTYNDTCNGGGSCSGTQCTPRTINFGNFSNKPIGSVTLWYPGQEEQVYLQSDAGRKAWIRVKYSETCHDAYVEMVGPSQHTNMCHVHGAYKCAPLKYADFLGAPLTNNCQSNINWWFDGQKKSLGQVAGCEAVYQLCNVKGGAGKQLFLQNTNWIGCHNACMQFANTNPNRSCNWMGYDVKF